MPVSTACSSASPRRSRPEPDRSHRGVPRADVPCRFRRPKLMRAALEHRLIARWYGERAAFWLLPLEGVYRAVTALRRRLYRCGVLRVHRVHAPVVIVGNLTVGGTGKTPLVLWLADRLQARGWQPGIASRGYGGEGMRTPMRVLPQSDPDLVGDEALLLAQR